MAVLFKTQFIKGSLNAIDIIATIAGSPIFVQTEKGLAVKLVSGASLTYAIPSSNITNLISYIKGIGTYRVTLGATNIDVAKATFDYQFQNSAGTYNSVTTVVITATSGTVFVNRLVLLNGTNEVNQLQVEFNNAQPINKPKKGFVLNKPTDLSEYKGTGAGQGLVAAYNMQKVGNTLVDISGSGNNLTQNGTVVSTKDGIGFPNSGYLAKTSFLPSPIGLANSISFRVKFKELGREQHIAEFYGNQRYLSPNNKIQMTGASNPLIGNTTIAKDIWYTITCLFKNPGAEIFINGVSDGSNVNYTENITTATLIIGHLYTASGNYILNGEIADLRIHNRVLTFQEIKDYNNSFIQPTLLEDFSDAGADNQASVPREWAKTSGSFKVVENVIKQGELVTNGDFSSDTWWSKSVNTTISNGAAHFLNQANEGGLYKASLLTLGKKYRITFTVSNYVLGGVKVEMGNTGNGTIYNYNGTFINELVCSGDTTLYIVAQGTSTFDIDNVSVTEIQPLQTINNGTKYLEAITTGVVATPNNTAYGSWEFDWYKGGNNNTSFQFIDQKIENFSGNSYWSLFTSATNNIGILYSNAFYIMQSSASYVNINTWYRIKITRTATGLFTVLIKGGTFVPTAGYDGWTLVSVAGGLGTNPVTDNTYTTSNYFVMSLGAGDRVTNIKITNGLSSVSIPPTWLYGDNVLSQFWGDNLGLELWGDNL